MYDKHTATASVAGAAAAPAAGDIARDGVVAELGEEAKQALFFDFIRSQTRGAVVTFIPLPALPGRGSNTGSSGGSDEDTETQARKYIDRIRSMTKDMGAIVFVRADDNQQVISHDL